MSQFNHQLFDLQNTLNNLSIQQKMLNTVDQVSSMNQSHKQYIKHVLLQNGQVLIDKIQWQTVKGILQQLNLIKSQRNEQRKSVNKVIIEMKQMNQQKLKQINDLKKKIQYQQRKSISFEVLQQSYVQNLRKIEKYERQNKKFDEENNNKDQLIQSLNRTILSQKSIAYDYLDQIKKLQEVLKQKQLSINNFKRQISETDSKSKIKIQELQQNKILSQSMISQLKQKVNSLQQKNKQYEVQISTINKQFNQNKSNWVKQNNKLLNDIAQQKRLGAQVYLRMRDNHDKQIKQKQLIEKKNQQIIEKKNKQIIELIKKNQIQRQQAKNKNQAKIKELTSIIKEKQIKQKQMIKLNSDKIRNLEQTIKKMNQQNSVLNKKVHVLEEQVIIQRNQKEKMIGRYNLKKQQYEQAKVEKQLMVKLTIQIDRLKLQNQKIQQLQQTIRLIIENNNQMKFVVALNSITQRALTQQRDQLHEQNKKLKLQLKKKQKQAKKNEINNKNKQNNNRGLFKGLQNIFKLSF